MNSLAGMPARAAWRGAHIGEPGLKLTRKPMAMSQHLDTRQEDNAVASSGRSEVAGKLDGERHVMVGAPVLHRVERRILKMPTYHKMRVSRMVEKWSGTSLA
jgi:hypothetical protein